MIARLIRRCRRRFARDIRAECGVWRRGELAVCVFSHWYPGNGCSPRLGDVLRVTAVIDELVRGKRAIFLQFEGRPPHIAWCANGFRKPVVRAAESDAEFLASLKPAKRVDVPLSKPEPVQ